MHALVLTRSETWMRGIQKAPFALLILALIAYGPAVSTLQYTSPASAPVALQTQTLLTVHAGFSPWKFGAGAGSTLLGLVGIGVGGYMTLGGLIVSALVRGGGGVILAGLIIGILGIAAIAVGGTLMATSFGGGGNDDDHDHDH